MAEAQLSPLFQTLPSGRQLNLWSQLKKVVLHSCHSSQILKTSIKAVCSGRSSKLKICFQLHSIAEIKFFFSNSAADKRRLSSGLHSPLFAVVMRSHTTTRQLECHGYVCQSPEDAIVIAATLYQSLMSHMSNSQNANRKKPKTRNGIGCVSVASSQATTNVVQSTKPSQSVVRTESQRSSVRSGANRRKRRPTNSSADQAERDIIRSALLEVSSGEERTKKKSSKNRRAPPVPSNPPPILCKQESFNAFTASMSYLEEQSKLKSNRQDSPQQQSGKPYISEPILQTFPETGGDILTKVAIPRSGSFLNTGDEISSLK